MHKFVRNLITEWRRLNLPFDGETVIVAVSGGADSTALLLALADLKKRKKLDLEFIAAHFNHRLRGKESNSDEAFVRKLAKGAVFKFYSGSGSLKGTSNLEERARNVRYEFFAKLAKQSKAVLVLTAHTMNDQAETIMMNLVRGTGIDGLVGTRKVRPLETGSKIQLVRPLLAWAKRTDTENFCLENKVAFRLDAMNEDLTFTRVRIRKSVLPLLAEINPKIVETLSRTAELLQPLDKGKITTVNGSIKLADLSDLSKNELYSHLRAWIGENRGNTRGLQLKHIEAVARLVNSPKSGRLVELPGGDSVIKHGGRLDFRHIKLEN
ncbi:MAG TPA: tRNA lysidine(34) synthetase TilS [Pyrinomonadaceae bacterium]|nr:tRNA lysidine(34) synthetase TilS [Pyrinomonadaceae bacterium]